VDEAIGVLLPDVLLVLEDWVKIELAVWVVLVGVLESTKFEPSTFKVEYGNTPSSERLNSPFSLGKYIIESSMLSFR